MPKRNFATLEEFKANLHQGGATLAELSGSKVPCLFVSGKDYDEIVQRLYGKVVRAEPLLDIFHDGRDVFVDVQIRFADTDFDKNYLLCANEMIEFFEALAETGLLAIALDARANANAQNIFVIQLPRKEAAEKALEIIKMNANRELARS